MHEFRLHTLVDITENGNLKQAFPFKTKQGEVIHDKHSLAIARDQNSNFNTILQLLQLRGNITWEHPPQKIELISLGNHAFGSYYEGTQHMALPVFHRTIRCFRRSNRPNRKIKGRLQSCTYFKQLQKHRTFSDWNFHYKKSLWH